MADHKKTHTTKATLTKKTAVPDWPAEKPRPSVSKPPVWQLHPIARIWRSDESEGPVAQFIVRRRGQIGFQHRSLWLLRTFCYY